MGLRDAINNDMKDAMRARDKEKLQTIRFLSAALKQIEVDERVELTDERIMDVVAKQIKQRKETIKIYEDNGHPESAEPERREIEWLKAYLPQQLGEAEIDAEVERAIAQNAASTIKDMGKVMAALKKSLAGRADMAVVGRIVKSKLS